MKFRISDPDGQTIVLEGDAPPTERELEELFSSRKSTLTRSESNFASASLPASVSEEFNRNLVQPDIDPSSFDPYWKREMPAIEPPTSTLGQAYDVLAEPGRMLTEAASVSPQTTQNAMDVVNAIWEGVKEPNRFQSGKFTEDLGQRDTAPGTAAQIVTGAQNLGAGVAGSFADPVNAGVMLATGGAPALAPLVDAAFGAHMLAQVPENIRQAQAAKTPYEKTMAYGGLGLNVGLGGALAGKGGVGAVREGMKLTPRGRADTAQLQAEQFQVAPRQKLVQEFNQISKMEASPERDAKLQQIKAQIEDAGLADSHQAVIDKAAESVDAPVKVVWGTDPSDLKPGQVARAGGADGKTIELIGENVGDWLANVRPSEREARVKALIKGEEQVHLQTASSDAERAGELASDADINNLGRIYGHDFTFKEIPGENPAAREQRMKQRNRDIGYELIRLEVNKAQKMTPGEFLEMSIGKRMKVQTLDAMHSFMEGVKRNVLRSNSSAARKAHMVESVDRVIENIKEARPAAEFREGRDPAGVREDEGRQIAKDLNLKWEGGYPLWQYSAFRDDGTPVTFGIKPGSTPEQIKAKADNMLSSFKGSAALGEGPAGIRSVDRESVASMSPDDYFKKSQQWSSDAMADESKPGPQIMAELAAKADPDVAKWSEGADKAVEEYQAIKSQVKADPSLMGDPEFQRKWSGAAQKIQFFNEAKDVLTGVKQFNPNTEKLWSEQRQPAGIRKSINEREERGFAESLVFRGAANNVTEAYRLIRDPKWLKDWAESQVFIGNANNVTEALRFLYDSGEDPAGIRKTADEIVARPRGETTAEEINAMDAAEAAKLFTYKNESGDKNYQPQYDAVFAGMKAGPQEIPKFEAMRDENHKAMMDAVKSGNQQELTSTMSKMMWASAAIEGAKREGGNYKSAVEIATKRGELPEFAQAAGVRSKKDVQDESSRFLRNISNLNDRDSINSTYDRFLTFVADSDKSLEKEASALGVTYNKRTGDPEYSYVSKENLPRAREIDGARIELGEQQFRMTQAVDRQTGGPAGVRKGKQEPERLMGVSQQLMLGAAPVARGEKIPERAIPYEKLTPSSLDALVAESLVRDIPSFEDFVGNARAKFGHDLKPEQLNDMWQSGIVKHLENASGPELTRLVDQLNLRRQVGTMRIGDAPVDVKGVESYRNSQIARSQRMDKLADKLEHEADVIKSKTERLAAPSGDRAAEVQQGELLSSGAQVDIERSRNVEREKLLRKRASQLREQSNNIASEARRAKEVPAEVSETAHQLGLGLFTPSGKSDVESTPLTTYTEKTRARAIGAIFQKLAMQSHSPRKSWNRKDVGVDELAWQKGPDAFQTITEHDMESRTVLGSLLTKGARSDASTSTTSEGGARRITMKGAPESVTKRVTVLLDKENGTVHQVSTYRHGRLGTMMLDPRFRGDVHRRMDMLLDRYRPIYTMLLNTPVKSFYKKFESIDDFNSQFGHEANNRSAQSSYGEASVGPEQDFSLDNSIYSSDYQNEMTPGTSVKEGEGGFVMGPSGQQTRAMLGMTRGALESGADLTPNEARIAYNAFKNLESAKDAHDLIQDLNSRALRTRSFDSSKADAIASRIATLEEKLKNPLTAGRAGIEERIAKHESELRRMREGTLTPSDMNLINAMRKVYESLRETHTDLTDGQIMDLTLEELYGIAKKNETERSAVASTTRQFAKEPSLPVQSGAQAQRGTELTMPIDRVPPTTIRPEQLPPGTPPVIRRPPPQEVGGHLGGLGPRQEAGMLSPSDKAALRRRINKQPAGIRKTVEKAIRQPVSAYSEWMVDRIARLGGPNSKVASEGFRHIIDRAKELYGSLTPLIDPAKEAAGGTVRNKAVGQVVNAQQMKAAKWLHGLNKITPWTARSNTVDAIEGSVAVPQFAHDVVQKGRDANIAIGNMIARVTPGFQAGGKFQRNMTATGVDIIREGGGDMWKRWTFGLAKDNWQWLTAQRQFALAHGLPDPGGPLQMVRDQFKDFKRVLDEPGVNSDVVDKVNQDFQRKFPNSITHVKGATGWEPVLHSDLFNYLENAAQRAAHIVAFREQFPNNAAGRKALSDIVTQASAELPPNGVADMHALIRTLQGRPTDTYSSFGIMGPTEAGGQALRMFNQTVGNLFAKLVLSGQLFRQPGENIAGSTPMFLGYANYLRGMAKAGEIYRDLEKNGAVNRVLYDFSYDPNSPLRSLSRIAGNTISKSFMEQWLNEVQEATAAATAKVVSDRIKAGDLSSWEKRMLPETFKSMGFTQSDVANMMLGDPALLGQFERKAAAFLTSGNKAVSENSWIGANRLANSIFRFQSYPMMKANQFSKVASRLYEAWGSGTAAEKRAATEQFSRFMGYNAAQGALTVGIAALMTQGLFGLKVAKNEAKDDPLNFMLESFMSSIGGPMYLMWRGAKEKNALHATDMATRMVFPFAIASDMRDMADGAGSYRDLEPWDKVAKFLKSKTPGLKPIQYGASLVGLSMHNPDLDTATSAYYRWFKETFKKDATAEASSDPFRTQMKKAVSALKDGDRDAYLKARASAVDSAIGGKSPSEERIAASFRSRKLLKTPEGGDLSIDQKESLRKRIGDEAYEKILDYNLMLETAADGL